MLSWHNGGWGQGGALVHTTLVQFFDAAGFLLAQARPALSS
jgi:hypothetical protein